MSWDYHCSACGMNITAQQKIELIDKIMRHFNLAHRMIRTREQVADVVEHKTAREMA